MKDQSSSVLYYGRLIKKEGESSPSLAAHVFYNAAAQYRGGTNLLLHEDGVPKIRLEKGYKLYIALEPGNNNEEPYQILLDRFRNNDMSDPEDWAFVQELQAKNKRQSGLIDTFSSNSGSFAFLLCPRKAPNHPEQSVVFEI